MSLIHFYRLPEIFIKDYIVYNSRVMSYLLERPKRRSRSHHHNRPILLSLIREDVLDNLPDLEF